MLQARGGGAMEEAGHRHMDSALNGKSSQILFPFQADIFVNIFYTYGSSLSSWDIIFVSHPSTGAAHQICGDGLQTACWLFSGFLSNTFVDSAATFVDIDDTVLTKDFLLTMRSLTQTAHSPENSRWSHDNDNIFAVNHCEVEQWCGKQTLTHFIYSPWFSCIQRIHAVHLILVGRFDLSQTNFNLMVALEEERSRNIHPPGTIRPVQSF